MKIYAIFRSNQFCIISLNNVTVLLKSVHAIRQCLDKGSFSKMTSFSLENKYLVLVLISSLELNSYKTDMALSCSNNCLIMRSNQKHVTQHNGLGNPRPFLMDSNLKLSRILNCTERSPLRHQSSSNNCSIELRSSLT